MFAIVSNIQWDTDDADVDLPERMTVLIPEDMEDDEEVGDYISDTITEKTGFCHGGCSYSIIGD